MSARPIPYMSSMEILAGDEAEVQAELVVQMEKIANIMYEHTGHAYRSVHAKSHGLLIGRLEVGKGLPPELAQGLFAQPGTYDAILRFSTPPGDVLDDSVSLSRALAVKVLGVPGDRVTGSEEATTQDFVMVNGPAFIKPDAKSFLSSLKMLAKTTDKAEGLKKALSVVLRGVETVVETFGGKSGKLAGMGGQLETHILGETFYTQVPLRFGDYVGKVAFFPSSPELQALTDAKLDVNGVPNGLREAVVAFFLRQGARWDVRVQLMTDQEKMPIEDASVVWSEKESPYVTVATLQVEPQSAWSEARVRAIDDGLAFNPWHALAAHQPLGGIMRARRVAYEAMSRLRHERDGVRHAEPRDVRDLGSLEDSDDMHIHA